MATVRSRITKGREFQKKIKQKLQVCFDLEDDDIRTAIGCETGEDIKLSRKAKQLIGLAIECKNQKNISIWAALEQAKRNTQENEDPALIFRRSISGNRETWICLPLEHYLEIRRKLIDNNS